MTRARGFSLVELMIAVAVTAFIGAVIAGTYQQVDRASTLVRDQSDRASAVRLSLARMTRELSMAYLSDHYDPARFRDRPTLFKGDDDKVLFTTMAHVRRYQDTAQSDQAVVEYLVERDPETGEEALFRREKVIIDDETDRGGRTELVADHVTRLNLRYWDRVRKEWVREWSTRSAERMNELPPRVKIELEVKGQDGKTSTYTTQARVAIPLPLDF
ncbi:MAG: type II secretion system GspH family protein [Anaeromyxobacteraceae bacterium]|nr:type II secretion system GspH family protein [Anaeromyxobacteraceae bacterium]